MGGKFFNSKSLTAKFVGNMYFIKIKNQKRSRPRKIWFNGNHIKFEHVSPKKFGQYNLHKTKKSKRIPQN